jgi:hypothetical protein
MAYPDSSASGLLAGSTNKPNTQVAISPNKGYSVIISQGHCCSDNETVLSSLGLGTSADTNYRVRKSPLLDWLTTRYFLFLGRSNGESQGREPQPSGWGSFFCFIARRRPQPRRCLLGSSFSHPFRHRHCFRKKQTLRCRGATGPRRYVGLMGVGNKSFFLSF